MAGIITDTNKLGGVPQSASKYVAMATCFDVYFGGAQGDGTQRQIGFISSLSIAHTRTVTQIRHLNSVDAGIPVDTVLLPDAITLSFGGFYVYSNAANTPALAGNTGVVTPGDNQGTGPTVGRMAGIQLLMTLDQQNIPFEILVSHRYPGATGSAAGTVAVIGAYRNCTISGMTIPINIGTAGVADTGTIVVGYVASSLT